MKKYLLLACLFALTAGVRAHASCSSPPSGYTVIGDVNYVEGLGIGYDIPGCIAYRYPSGGTDYSQVDFYFTTTSASSCAVLPNIGQVNDQAFNGNLITIAAANGSHDCYVTVPNYSAGTIASYAFAGCKGTTCTRLSYNASGSGGWSSAPLGSNLSAYCLPSGSNVTTAGLCALPLPAAGTPAWSMFIEYDPTPPAGHFGLGGITGVMQSGTIPPRVSYQVTVDGTPCAATLAGCTINGVTTQIACQNAMIPRASSSNWNVELLGSQFYCGNTPIGWPTTAQQVIYTLSPSASGTHTIDIIGQGLDASNNPIGPATATASLTFTVTAPVSLPYTPPTSYTPLPSGFAANWIYNVAGTSSLSSPLPGYMFFANSWLADQVTTPGQFFNDTSGPTLWDIPPYAMGFYDVGRFPQLFGDLLGTCHSQTVTSCTNWAASTPVTKGQILDVGPGTCLVDVTTNGITGSTAPSCPTSCSGSATGYSGYGCAVSDGTATETSLAEPQQWYQFAQNEGDQFRNSKLLSYVGLPSFEWDSFTLGYEERYFRRNRDQLDANAIACMLYPFIHANGCNLENSLQYDGYTPIGTVRILPLDLIALDEWWRITGTKPMDSTSGIDLIQRWSDLLAVAMRKLVSCSPSGNITAGYPHCANNVMLESENFDSSLMVNAAEETVQVEYEKTGTVDAALLSALYNLLDWEYYYQYAPFVTAYGTHTMPYTTFAFPEGGPGVNVDFSQSELNPLMMDGFAFMGGWCNNCSPPLSAVPFWQIGDDYFTHSFDNVSLSAKQYGQLYQGYSSYLHHRTSPSNGGWTAVQSEASAALNPYDSTFPNLLGPYASGSYWTQPSCVPTTSGAGTCTWQSPPTASTKIRLAVAPADPYGGGSGITTFTCGAGTGCNVNDNLCTDTCSFGGMASDTYNVSLVGADSAGNTAETDQNWNGGYYQVTVSGTAIAITGNLPDGTFGQSYSATLGAANGTPPYTFATTFCVGPACSGTNVAGLSMSAGGTYSGTPTKTGGATVTVVATDANSNHSPPTLFSISIGASPSAGGFRGEFRGQVR